ncbi:transmembrane gamma-carboxyglutamic acid protein 4 [Tamandua tetradactyla]|uniref:transmembrane gamma-carboxyglutamic acid protein 4 n=1 Tax=Tamandua tetradactyla TaxID=48850 RepID=UPI004054121A
MRTKSSPEFRDGESRNEWQTRQPCRQAGLREEAERSGRARPGAPEYLRPPSPAPLGGRPRLRQEHRPRACPGWPERPYADPHAPPPPERGRHLRLAESETRRVAEIVGVAPATAGLAASGTTQERSSGPGAPGTCVPGYKREAGRRGPPRRSSWHTKSDPKAERSGARGDRCPLDPRRSPCGRRWAPGTLGGSLRRAGRGAEAETERGTQSRCGFQHSSLFDSCQTVFTFLVLLSQLPIVTFAFPHCTRSSRDPRHAGEEVFTSKEDANFFIQRHLLYNRFDMELLTPGDVERECNEELCNYEEAREIFVDEDKTLKFWQDYLIKGPATKSDGDREKVDVMGLLTGLIAAGVFLVTFGLLGYYLCITKCNRQRHPSSSAVYMSRRGHNPSIVFSSPEEVVLSPLPSSVEDTGLPSYEEAVVLARKRSVSPPPPYPGPAPEFRVFKKSMSLPS